VASAHLRASPPPRSSSCAHQARDGLPGTAYVEPWAKSGSRTAVPAATSRGLGEACLSFSRSTTPMVTGSTIGSRTSGCCAPTVMRRRRPTATTSTAATTLTKRVHQQRSSSAGRRTASGILLVQH